MTESSIEKTLAWYRQRAGLYKDLAGRVHAILEDNLHLRSLAFHRVESRGKDLDSLRRKLERKSYANPIEEIKDFAGVRVVCYVDSEVEAACRLVESLFDVDPNHSKNKAEELGIDRFGYRSVHYVATMSLNRSTLPEFERFSGCAFEVQVRTILEHAWAEVEHDRNYKFQGALPDELKRRFTVLSGVLELADREFGQIAREIDAYAADVAEKAKLGDLVVEINTVSLREYLNLRFEKEIEQGIIIPEFYQTSQEVIDEMRAFGLTSIRQFHELIPDDIVLRIIKFEGTNTFAGLVRDVLMISDAKRYFRNSWNRHWAEADGSTLALLSSYGVNVSIVSGNVSVVYDGDQE